MTKSQNTTCYDMAKVMLGLKDYEPLPDSLFKLIADTDQLANDVGGQLWSRQAVAILVAIWRKDGVTVSTGSATVVQSNTKVGDTL